MTLRDSQAEDVADAAGSSMLTIDPALLRALTRDYARLVQDRLEENGKVVDRHVAARARRFAETIGHHNAPARAVAMLHVDAVERLCHGRNDRRVRAVTTGATLLLAEVLGHLANHYRGRALGGA